MKASLQPKPHVILEMTHDEALMLSRLCWYTQTVPRAIAESSDCVLLTESDAKAIMNTARHTLDTVL
jgi:hypothetical protein